MHIIHIVHMYVDMYIASSVIVYNTPNRGQKTGNGGRIGRRVREKRNERGRGERGRVREEKPYTHTISASCSTHWVRRWLDIQPHLIH